MPNLPYHLARLEGETRRRLYLRALPMIVQRKVRVRNELALEVVAYSGERTLPEQVASIRSFLTHAGRPKRFTIFSDGSYTAPSIRLLEKIDPAVHVSESLPAPAPELPERIRRYLIEHPTGKQLCLIMSLPINAPVLYADSDVLFFPGAHDLALSVGARSAPAFYLADCQFAGDERLLSDPIEKRDPANTGFLLFFEQLDWSLGLKRLLALKGEPNFFTNQTITHLTMHANRALSFDPRKYVLQLDDQFVYRDKYASASLAMRHYVNPVRHKFWTYFARRARE